MQENRGTRETVGQGRELGGENPLRVPHISLPLTLCLGSEALLPPSCAVLDKALKLSGLQWPYP